MNSSYIPAQLSLKNNLHVGQIVTCVNYLFIYLFLVNINFLLTKAVHNNFLLYQKVINLLSSILDDVNQYTIKNLKKNKMKVKTKN